MGFSGKVPCQDDGLRSHLGDEVIAWVFDLAFVSDIEPSTREYPFLLFLVDILIHENFAADFAYARIDHVVGGIISAFQFSLARMFRLGYDFIQHLLCQSCARHRNT